MPDLITVFHNLMHRQSAWRGGVDPAITEVYAALKARIDVEGSVEFRIRPNGVMEHDEGVLPANTDPLCLGTALARVGVGLLRFLPGLRSQDITKLFTTVALFDGQRGEHDLVTFWFEEGSPAIELGALRLAPDPAPNLAETAWLEAVIAGSPRAMTGMRHLAGAASNDGLFTLQRQSMVQIQGAMAWAEDLRADTFLKVQQQLLNSLVALLSAKTIRLSHNEFAVLFRAVLFRYLEEGRFDLVMQAVSHLESLTSDQAYVPDRTRDITKQVVRKMRSPRMLERMIVAFASNSDTGPHPLPVVRWILKDSPLTLWNAVVPKIALNQVGAAAILFSLAIDFQHPFWGEAVRGLDTERKELVRRALSQLSSTIFSNSARPVSGRSTQGIGAVRPETGPTMSLASDDDDGWDGFDLGFLGEESLVDELDESILEFLRDRTSFKKA